MKVLWSLVVLLLFSVPAFSEEDDLIGTARLYYNNREYYNVITEIMRYQFFYPDGSRYAESMVLMGQALYLGGDPSGALSVFGDCYSRFPDSLTGQQGLYYSGFIRMKEGSYYYAVRKFQEYNYVYKDGEFYEDSVFNLCRLRILAEEYSDAEKALAGYREQFPEGKYFEESAELSSRIRDQESKSLKKPWLAGLCSALVPGMGYIYTEKYMLGIFSFLSNAGLIYLAYDGYRDGNMFRMAVFSVIEFSFYNWAITGSVLSAREYNDNRNFSKEIILRIKTPF